MPAVVELYWSSLPQALHVAEPAGAYVPAVQGVRTWLPEHAWPAGHWEHDVRVDASPPLV